MIRYLTAGESHGPALVVVVEGLPAGLGYRWRTSRVSWADAGSATAGARMRFEQDDVAIRGGVRHGRTLGSPVAIEVANTEWTRNPEKWGTEMSVRAEDGPRGPRSPAPARSCRPGRHAKYGFTDARDVLERASARETAARVAAGTLAKLLLRSIGVEIISHVLQLGSVRSKATARPGPADLATVDGSEVRCFDQAAEDAMVEEIKAAAKDGDSLGGVVEVLAYDVPVGLGSHVHWDRKLDGLLACALMSIQAVKGVEIGEGFDVAGRRGSAAHDPITWDAAAGYQRGGSRAGGIEGGMSTGELIVAHVAMKPLATLNKPTLKTVDVLTKAESVSFKERTDVTAVPAMGVVAETMCALVLADEVTRKFGGDSVGELVGNCNRFLGGLEDGPLG
ncbi:MAG: chorismate synthase [Acidimicrobiales bacterium]